MRWTRLIDLLPHCPFTSSPSNLLSHFLLGRCFSSDSSACNHVRFHFNQNPSSFTNPLFAHLLNKDLTFDQLLPFALDFGLLHLEAAAARSVDELQRYTEYVRDGFALCQDPALLETITATTCLCAHLLQVTGQDNAKGDC